MIEEEVRKRNFKCLDYPAFGQLHASNEPNQKGIFISPAGVRSAWLRHDFETFKKRLKSLEARMAQDGLILTDAQLNVLEKAKEVKKALEK